MCEHLRTDMRRKWQEIARFHAGLLFCHGLLTICDQWL